MGTIYKKYPILYTYFKEHDSVDYNFVSFSIKDVRDHTLEDRMESFFLSETTKYLYLLFDTDNFIHNSGAKATLIQTPRGQCVIDAGLRKHFKIRNFYLNLFFK